MKHQIFINNVHEYDYSLIDDNLYTLYYSNASDWISHLKETIAMQIKDDVNGLRVKFNEENKIDYSEAEQLFILLKLINSSVKYEIASKILL